MWNLLTETHMCRQRLPLLKSKKMFYKCGERCLSTDVSHTIDYSNREDIVFSFLITILIWTWRETKPWQIKHVFLGCCNFLVVLLILKMIKTGFTPVKKIFFRFWGLLYIFFPNMIKWYQSSWIRCFSFINSTDIRLSLPLLVFSPPTIPDTVLITRTRCFFIKGCTGLVH